MSELIDCKFRKSPGISLALLIGHKNSYEEHLSSNSSHHSLSGSISLNCRLTRVFFIGINLINSGSSIFCLSYYSYFLINSDSDSS
jgi:hypothetical protein